ncbi:MAG: heavy metal-associated domain-containing protein [Balneolaceae bacterium]
MKPIKQHYPFLLSALAILLMLIPLGNVKAQILELDQKIFGMDCAPCAKGVEVRMKKMDGVTDAEIDLKKGEARLIFDDAHHTSLKQIQRSIIDGGFSPKDAQIKVRGMLEKEQDDWHLITDTDDIFLLKEFDAEQYEIETGREVTIEALIAERDNQDFWNLTVDQLKATEKS